MTDNYLPQLGAGSALGRSIRLRRLFGEDGKAVVVALDQAVPRGVVPRLAAIRDTYSQIDAGGPDGVTVSKGIAATLFSGSGRPRPWILKASTFSVDFHATYDATVATVDEAVRLGADAVAVGISAGSSVQAQMFEMLAAVTARASEVGMPTVCHAYPSGEMWGDRKGSAESVLYAARAASELGVDIIKTWYTGSTESFSKVVDGTPGLVMVAGGAKLDNDLAVLELAESAVDAGAAGLTIGRNVWGADDPAGMVKALKAIVHNGTSASEAARAHLTAGPA
jgi:class I fructose-bisphosphate aldolase